MGETDPAAIAVRFNDRINSRDIVGLAELMADGHTFIDSQGNTVSGKPECVDAWRGFFASFPDYRSIFTSVTAHEDVVTIVGHSECAEPALAGPALWTAKIRGNQVAEWHVHEDTPQTRQQLAR